MVASGSGKAKITIKWNTSFLVCNKNFYNGTIYTFVTGELVPPVTVGNISTLVINADTSVIENGNRNRYDIQFYKNGTDPSSWGFCSITNSNTPTEPSGNVWLTVNVEKQ